MPSACWRHRGLHMMLVSWKKREKESNHNLRKISSVDELFRSVAPQVAPPRDASCEISSVAECIAAILTRQVADLVVDVVLRVTLCRSRIVSGRCHYFASVGGLVSESVGIIRSTGFPIAFHCLIVLIWPLWTPSGSTGWGANGQNRRDEQALYVHSVCSMEQISLAFAGTGSLNILALWIWH